MSGVHMNSESQLDPGGQKAVVKVSKSYMGLRMTSEYGAPYFQRYARTVDDHQLPLHLHKIHDLTSLVTNIP